MCSDRIVKPLQSDRYKVIIVLAMLVTLDRNVRQYS